MAHIDLSHADMKPRAVVDYEIARDKGFAKQMLAAAIISTAMVLVIAALFMSVMR